MNNELKSYPQMKYTSIEWLGYIPQHWNCVKLGSKFRERRTKVSDKEYMPLSVTKHGIVPQLATAAKSNDGDNRKLVKNGDFVINSRSDRKGSSGLSKHNGSVSLINIVLAPHQIDPQYAHYLFKSNRFVEEYYRNGRGIVADLWTTRFYEMRNINIPIPSEPEQVQIVKYLDQQLIKINKFIKAKKKLIVALKEQRQAIINEAVTKGLDLNVKMKHSSLIWIGKMPNHWTEMKGKYLLKEVNCRSENGNEELLTVSHITGVSPRSQKNVTMFKAETIEGYKLCSVGDIAVNTMWAWMGAVAISEYDGVISPSYNVYRCITSDFNRKYLDLLLRVSSVVSEYKVRSIGLRPSRLRLYPNEFLSIKFPIPPINEQTEIVDFIHFRTSNLNNVIERIEAEIKLISEYKEALISDVVTGKVDVRNIAVEESGYEPIEDAELDEDLADEETLESEDGDE